MNGDKGKVLIAWLDPGMVEGAFCDTLAGLVLMGAADHLLAGWVRTETGPMVAWARNGVVAQFLSDKKADWLLFLDSDLRVPHNLTHLLLEVADPVQRPVVAGLYFGVKKDGMFPVAYQLVDEVMTPVAPTDEKMVQVDGVGAGCLLLHRSALEKSKDTIKPGVWFDHIFHAGRSIGEDLSFCYRLREAGIPVWLRQDVPLVHLKWRMKLDRAAWGRAVEQGKVVQHG